MRDVRYKRFESVYGGINKDCLKRNVACTGPFRSLYCSRSFSHIDFIDHVSRGYFSLDDSAGATPGHDG